MKKNNFLLVLFVSLVFSSCNFETVFNPDWNEPLENFFKEYTSNAAIENHAVDEVFSIGVNNITYLTSENDVTVTFYLRNPMDYVLTPSFELKDGTDSGFEIRQDPADMGVIYLTYSQELLFNRDCSDKDVSGTVGLYHPETGRTFDSYSFSYRVNTEPPSIQRAVFQASSASGDERKYIVCFYLPELNNESMQVHKNDTRVIYIDDFKKYFDGGKIYKTAEKNESGEWEFKDEDTAFTSSVESCFPIESDGITFNAAGITGYTPVFWSTGEVVSDNLVTHTFKIVDDEGFSSFTAISNKAEKLNPPVQDDTANKSVDEDTGYYAYTFTHDLKTTSGNAVTGEFKYFYTITEKNDKPVFYAGSSSVYTGSAVTSDGRAVINLPCGNFKISISAAKDYYVTSDELNVDNIAVTGSANIYISNSGKDKENSGSKKSPFASIDRALEIIRQRDENTTDYNIIIDGAAIVKSTSAIDISDCCNSITFEKLAESEFDQALIKSEGSNRVLNLAGGKFIFRDVTVTGGTTTDNGPGILINGANVTFDGITVRENYTTGDSAYCGGVYLAYGDLNMQGANIIKDNYKKTDGEVTASNLCTATNKTITVTGSLAGSDIHVSTIQTPMPGSYIILTSGYSAYNTAKPQKYFTGDAARIVLNSNEVAVTANSAVSISPSSIKFTASLVGSSENSVTSVKALKETSLQIKLEVAYSDTQSGNHLFYNPYDNKIYTDSSYAMLLTDDEEVLWNVYIKDAAGNEGLTFDDESIFIPGNTLYAGNYTVYIELEYLGVSYDTSVQLTCSE